MSPSSPYTLQARQDLVLDAAEALFYTRGVHEVGMDELVRATGLGKATVYRLYATKDALIGAWLQRRADRILALIDAHPPESALESVLDAVAADVASPGFRGCAFNNASIEFSDPDHPARRVAREYRAALLDRLRAHAPDELAAALALIIDGMYTSAAHLGPDGPAAHGPALARRLIAASRRSR